MLRIQYHSFGGPEVMQLENYEPPALRKDEIFVKVKAASINPLDWKLRQGFMKLMIGGRFPRGMGIDFAGVVKAVGPAATGFAAGDEVLGSTPMKASGAFAEGVVTTSDLVIRKPSALPFAEASTLPTVGVTAWRALIDAGKLGAGQSVFLNGAGGGVGQASIAIARLVGATVTVRVGPSSQAEMTSMGLEGVLDYRHPLPQRLEQAFDVVFDCHGGLSPAEERFLLKKSGVAVDIDPTVGNLIRSVLSSKHRFVRGVPNLGILQKIADLAAEDRFAIPISRTASLSEAIPLIGKLEKGNRMLGKAIIVM